MKQRLRNLGAVILLLSLLVTISACQASSSGDKVIFGGSQVIETDLDGDLTVFGGTAVIEEEATVKGDLAIFGGTVTNKGIVEGDVAIFGGVLERGSDTVQGNIVSIGGRENRLSPPDPPGDGQGEPTPPEDHGGHEAPEEEQLASPETDPDTALPASEPGPAAVSAPSIADRAFSSVVGIIQTFLKVIAFGALGLGLALFLPEHVRRAGQTAGEAPFMSAGIGCISFFALAVLSIFLAITLIGIPVAALLAPTGIALMIFGWIGLGYFFGDRLLRSADVRSPRPAAATAIGSAGLFLISSLINTLPVIGWVVFPVLSVWALGAALLSRGGTSTYPRRTRLVTAAAPAHPAPPDETVSPAPPEQKPSNDLFADLARDLGIEKELREKENKQPEDDDRPPEERS